MCTVHYSSQAESMLDNIADSKSLSCAMSETHRV